MSAVLDIIRHDLALAWRQGNSSAMAVSFFVIAVTMYPLGIGPDPQLLARIAAGILWVAAMLSALLSLDRLFHQDYEDGSLDLLVMSPVPLEATVAAKAVAHWLATGLPLVLAAPVLALVLNMGGDGLQILVVSMLIGTPALSFIGAIGAALTVTIKQGGVLITLLILPLYIPTLIFGVGAIDAVVNNIVAGPSLMYLGAITLASAALAPFAGAAALRLAVE